MARFSRTGEPIEKYGGPGSYGVITAWLKPGIWTVDVTATDFKSSSQALQVDADMVCTATMRLEVDNHDCVGCGSQAALVVRVTDQEGWPLPGVQVEVGGITRTSDSNGSAKFEGLQPGKYVVGTSLAGFKAKGVTARAIGGREIVVLAMMSLVPVY